VTALLFVLATGADSITMLLMGRDNEVNPLVLAVGLDFGLLLRWTAVAALLVLVRWIEVNPRPFLLIGAAVGVIGAFSNVRNMAITAGFPLI